MDTVTLRIRYLFNYGVSIPSDADANNLACERSIGGKGEAEMGMVINKFHTVYFAAKAREAGRRVFWEAIARKEIPTFRIGRMIRIGVTRRVAP